MVNSSVESCGIMFNEIIGHVLNANFLDCICQENNAHVTAAVT